MNTTIASEKKTQIAKAVASIVLTALILAAIALWISFANEDGNVISISGDPVPTEEAGLATDVAYADEGAIEATESGAAIEAQDNVANSSAEELHFTSSTGEKQMVVVSSEDLPETAKLVGTAYQSKDTGEVRIILATD